MDNTINLGYNDKLRQYEEIENIIKNSVLYYSKTTISQVDENEFDIILNNIYTYLRIDKIPNQLLTRIKIELKDDKEYIIVKESLLKNRETLYIKL